MATSDGGMTLGELWLLHDELRYALEDSTGSFYHEEHFERVFNAWEEEIRDR